MRDESVVSEWKSSLSAVYGRERAAELSTAVQTLLDRHHGSAATIRRWSERDAWLIAYPDQVTTPGEAPLRTLHRFYRRDLATAFNGVHILPFFPATSDEGFSIRDYEAVDSAMGTWADIEAIGTDARLMVDAVINHSSVESKCFQGWADGDPTYGGFIRTADPDTDLSMTVRAREHPLLTPFETSRGTEWVWTTFSADQADLNYGNPNVLLFVLSLLLSFAEHGASMIRLDAVCFLWKEEGTPSIHLPQTHQIIQFFRSCLDSTYPNIVLVSETNVPHRENVSYLGDGSKPEADMVYQFTLPPLVLHSFSTGSAIDLAEWLDTVSPTPPNTTFLNFLASHDGVGLRPLEGLVDDAAVERLVRDAEAHGGRANRRTRPDGTTVPYELNATWYDLIRGSTSGADAMARHLASHAIMFAITGIPAVYIHGLLATENDLDLVAETRAGRSINRSRLDLDALDRLLADPKSRASVSLVQIDSMLRLRRSTEAFNPSSRQVVLHTPPSVVGVERRSDSGEIARVYVNVSGEAVDVSHRFPATPVGHRCEATSDGLHLEPWGFAWLVDRGEIPDSQ
jgi:glycosidase